MDQGTELPQFTTATIERMELVILSALSWRMRSITPFAFLDFFLHSFPLADAALRHSLKDRASKTLFQAQNGNRLDHRSFLFLLFRDSDLSVILTFLEGKFLEFKPSTIAASALLTAAFELVPTHFPSFRSTLLSCEFVDEVRQLFSQKNYESSFFNYCLFCFVLFSRLKENLSAGCDAMLSAAMDGGSEQDVKKPGSSSDSTVTVLGRRDSENDRTVGSSLHDRDAKKTHLA